MKKQDQLYVLGNGSRHNDIELRFSLRSLEQNCKGYGRIFVVGRKPEWLTNVDFIPCEDNMGAAHKNIMKKILLACESDISDWFTLQADDHFYVRPYDFRRNRPYNKGELKPALAELEDVTEYRLSMVDTYHYLHDNGLPTMNGSQHCGCVFNKTLVQKLEDELFRPTLDYKYGIEPSSLMSACINKYLGIPYEYRKDIKISEFCGEQDLRGRIGDNFCFSIHDRAFQNLILPILQRWFPKPSIYELQ